MKMRKIGIRMTGEKNLKMEVNRTMRKLMQKMAKKMEEKTEDKTEVRNATTKNSTMRVGSGCFLVKEDSDEFRRNVRVSANRGQLVSRILKPFFKFCSKPFRGSIDVVQFMC
mmetsp:Transcript_2820/g.7407  ORF Transcript_2820/g.7407 Transcript_2820/m.7407 type:complete len:112 (-) Transcript_2820:53-388(-)